LEDGFCIFQIQEEKLPIVFSSLIRIDLNSI
jgi:hypothetical protein